MEFNEWNKELPREPQTPQDWEVAVDEAIDYYKYQISSWLEELNQGDMTGQPFHDYGQSFDLDR